MCDFPIEDAKDGTNYIDLVTKKITVEKVHEIVGKDGPVNIKK